MIKPRTKTTTGFTMIELLVVTTIIIVLTAIGLVSYQSASRNARNGKRKADLETIRSALVLYRTDIGSYPTMTTSNITTLLSTISSYVSSTTILDPKNTGLYVYSYTSTDGRTFSLCGRQEPDPGVVFCLANP